MLTLPFPAHVQQPLIQTVVDALRRAPTRVRAPAESGARTTLVIDRLLAAYYSRQRGAR